MTITETLKEIGVDIIDILKKESPLTQDEIYAKRGRHTISYFGYSHAMDKLLEEKKIEICEEEKEGHLLYKLVMKAV